MLSVCPCNRWQDPRIRRATKNFKFQWFNSQRPFIHKAWQGKAPRQLFLLWLSTWKRCTTTQVEKLCFISQLFGCRFLSLVSNPAVWEEDRLGCSHPAAIFLGYFCCTLYFWNQIVRVWTFKWWLSRNLWLNKAPGPVWRGAYFLRHRSRKLGL